MRVTRKRKPTPKKTRTRATKARRTWRVPTWREVVRAVARVFLWVFAVQFGVVVLFAVVNPPTNFYIMSERWRLGAVKQDWVAIADISPDMARSVVAAEDADFCQHWGFDLNAIRAVVNSKSKVRRGASTLTQQVAKNVFLWPSRTWVRKFFEAEITLLVELVWSKRRIVEVYLNVAEFDEGVFGVPAAAQHYFGVPARNLTLTQAARLAAILPSPRTRSASKPSAATLKRARAIVSGAETIAADGRDRCFSS